MASFVSQRQVTYDSAKNIIFEKKFDTAIRETFAHSFFQRLESLNLTPHDEAMEDHIPKLKESAKTYIQDTTFMGVIMKKILTSPACSRLLVLPHRFTSRLMAVVTKIYEIQIHYMNESNYLPNKGLMLQKVQEYLNTRELPLSIIYALDIATWLSIVIDKSSNLAVPRRNKTEEEYVEYLGRWNHYGRDDLDLDLVIGSDVIVLECQGKTWLCAKPCLLMIHNKICDYISVALLSIFSQGTYNPSDTYEIVNQFILCLCQLLAQYKNDYYTIAKGLETLCIAETLIEHEEWTNREFLVNAAADLITETGFCYYGSELEFLLRSVPTSLRHELSCLSKLLGHPYVSMKGGSESLYDKTHETYTLNLERIQQCICYVKENYIRNHVLKYKRWPPVNLLPQCPKALEQCCLYNKDPCDPFMVRKNGSVRIEDYDYIELRQNEKFSKLENILPYLKDKTVSVLRSDVMKMYLDNTHTSTKIPWENTRLLLAYLLNPGIVSDHVKFINQYENSDDLSDLLDYLVIRIVPKEKELKIDFRGFGATSLLNRMRLLAQEKNAMNFLDKYSDEQAMTLSELPLLKRLTAFRNLSKAYTGHKIIYIVIDASSWNNHFRSETVDRVAGQSLDDIFGTTIYGKTHLAYQRTLVYVPNRPVTYYWDGQSGGIEGLNQDTWVIVYLPQIKTAMEGLGLKYHLLCKGDDLRMAVAVPPSVYNATPIHDLKQEIVQRVSNTMTAFGHKIKVMESYGSSKYFAFSKSASLEEVELPQGFRKIQKCYGATNAIIQTLDEYIASSMSNAHSACKVQPSITPSYLTGLCWSVYYLLVSRKYMSLPDDAIIGLLLTPSMCGGFPIVYLHNMFVRAESDLFSPFLGLYLYCQKMFPEVAQYMKNMMLAPMDIPLDFKQLYKDPYSIPTLRPPLPSNILRDIVRPVLKKFTKNEDVKELLSMVDSQQTDAIMNCLASCSELNARVLSCIYACTPEGLLEELLKQFEDGRSINELVIRTLGSKKATLGLKKVVRADYHLQEWRVHMIKGTYRSRSIDYSQFVTGCPTQSAHDIRRRLWGREVTGITMPPLQHQVTFMTSLQGCLHDWCNNNHFTYTISDPIKYANKSYLTRHYASGGCKAYEGYKTSSGSTEPSVYMIEKDACAKKLKELMSLISWTNTSYYDEDKQQRVMSNAFDLLKVIASMYTDVPLDTLYPFASKRRHGTVTHHMQCPSYRSSIVTNVLSNIFTQFTGESNTHLRLRMSKEHYTVNMLHIYCHAALIGFQELEVSNAITTPKLYWGVTTDCTHCNRPIIEKPLVFDIRLIDGIRFHPIALSKVGVVAQHIIRESLDLCNDRVYNVGTNMRSELPLEVYYLGLLQNVHDTTHTHRQALQTRYTQHAATDDAFMILNRLAPAAKSRDISLSELKRIPINVLLEYLCHIICYYTSRLGCGSDKELDAMTMMVIPAEQLPWYGLIAYTYKIGRLPRLVAEFTNMLGAPPPTCYYSVVGASRYIGAHAKQIISHIHPTETVVILSNYVNSHIEVQIKKVWLANVYWYVTKYIKDKVQDFKTAQQRGIILAGYAELAGRVLRELVLVTVIINMLSDYAEEYARVVSDDQLDTSIPFIPIEDIDIEHIQEFFEDEDYHIPSYIKTLFVRLHKAGIDVDQVEFTDFSEWDECKYHILANITGKTVNAYTVTLTDCITNVRARPLEEITQDNTIPEIATFIPPNPSVVLPIKLPSPTTPITAQSYCHPVDTPDIRGLGPLTPHSFIPHSGLINLYGSVQASESVFLHIFNSVFDGKPDTSYRQGVLALADGLGGGTIACQAFLPNATYVFHTIPEDPAQEVIAAHSLVLGGAESIITQHLNEGHTSLHTMGFYHRIARYNIYYGYLFCDLELGSEDLCDYRDIYYHIWKFFLEWRINPGCLIIKVRLDLGAENIKILDVLSNMCEHTYLHYPLGEPKPHYAFIVARGIRAATLVELNIIWSSPPSSANATAYNRFINKLKKYFAHVQQLYQEGYNVLQYKHTSLTSYACQYALIPLRVLTLLSVWLNTAIDIVSDDSAWLKVKSISKIIKNCEPIWSILRYNPLVECQKNLNRLNDIQYSSIEVRCYADTQARRLVYLHQYFLNLGVLYITSQFRGVKEPCYISDQNAYNFFSLRYHDLEARDKYSGCPTLDNWTSAWVVDGIRIPYLDSYRHGLDLGLALMSYFAICSRSTKKGYLKIQQNN